MKKLILPLFIGLTCAVVAAAPQDSRCYELRVYYAAPGKLDDLNARFRNYTLKLFEKHGMSNLGYWMPVENPDQKLIYLLAFPSREAAKASWKAFMADPEWKAVAQKTEAKGRLVTKVESTYLAATDFSPAIRPSVASTPRTFEMRTYHAAPGKLDALLGRFRNHTVGLFTKHGIGQFGYWVPTDKEKGADNTLVYLLVHQSSDAAAAAFKEFRADPDWVAAKAASEKDGPLTLPGTNGVQSVFMSATDYSPTK